MTSPEKISVGLLSSPVLLSLNIELSLSKASEIPKIQIGKGNMETTLGTEPTIFVHKFISFCLFLWVTLSATGLADCQNYGSEKASNFPVRRTKEFPL
jgi:hypothetical protein